MHGKHISQLLWLLLVCLWPWIGNAQGLTEAQYQALNTDITITHASEFATAVAAADFQFMADQYNLQASPVYWVWRTQLPEKEIYEAVVEGKSWNFTTFQAQSVQERDSWQLMTRPGTINPSLAQVRANFDKIFQGTGAPAAQRDYLLTVSRRQALRGEQLFAVASPGGTGQRGSTANPDTLAFIGTLSYYDVFYALTGNRP